MPCTGVPAWSATDLAHTPRFEVPNFDGRARASSIKCSASTPVSHERGQLVATLPPFPWHTTTWSGGERQPLRCDITHSRHNRWSVFSERDRHAARQGRHRGRLRLSDLHRKELFAASCPPHPLHPERRPLQGKLGAAIAVITSLIVGFLAIELFRNPPVAPRPVLTSPGAVKARHGPSIRPGRIPADNGPRGYYRLLTMLAAESPKLQELDPRVRVDLQRGTAGSLSCPLKTKPKRYRVTIEGSDATGYPPGVLEGPPRRSGWRSLRPYPAWSAHVQTPVQVHGDPVVVGQRTEIQCEGFGGACSTAVSGWTSPCRGGRAVRTTVGEEAAGCSSDNATRPWWKKRWATRCPRRWS
ncbi:hypothetical protein Q5P01_021934 [Channa striata]|uniref:Uncharacterized protein n=1 Tax=Channa striata TaxID=64152 RepID=A0AA88IW20_CHASR|nr:hypothetical protein Q5P01_021934 [Channa striata]